MNREEGSVMWNQLHVVLCVGATVLLASPVAFPEEHEDQQGLLKLLPGAKVTLLQGLQASRPQGEPISAKFEVDEGKFQLSVYTNKAGAFSEVVVDHTTGKVAKAEPITGGDDLAEAKSQAAAMAKAKSSLAAAVEKAEHELAGSRAIAVAPEVRQGHAVAVVTLLKGTQFRSLSEPLE
jgi:hypothetical protein